MYISSTEVQNNFGKYLMLAAKEDVIITRNGTVVAKLTTVYGEDDAGEDPAGTINEAAAKYNSGYGRFGGRKATYEEFLELTSDNEERYEYIDGEIYYLASPRTAHQIALTELFVIFYNWFKGKKCTPMVAPYDITLKRVQDNSYTEQPDNPKKNINMVQPDIMVICNLEDKLNERDYYMGTPALVVEIISESTRGKDLIKKLDLYMSCGVEEYWTVNPASREVAVYCYKDNDLLNNAVFKRSDIAESFIFKGLVVELDKIFR